MFRIQLARNVKRAALCLFVLSGSCVLTAQTAAPAQKTKKVQQAPKYEMREVSGCIKDAATNEPIPGVRVQALDNRYYTAMTDENGNYTIKVPKFVTSLYIATELYAPVQHAIKGDTGQDVKLFTDQLSTIYKDGTEILSKSAMHVDNTSAITVENDIENKLAGSVRTISRGGLPAQGAAMFINGLNSLNTNSQPLIVIDGVICDMQYDRSTLHDGFVTNVFNMVDPEDIESVEVLKNGTALYGARGGNGVILINTKRGKSMETRINIRLFGGYEMMPSKVKMMDASQYRNYVTELIGTTPEADRVSSNVNIPFLNEDKNYLFYDLYHNNTDWQKDLYEGALTQNYKVSVAGGDDVAMYNLSLGYTMADATAKQNDFNRLNIRFNTDVSLFRNLTTQLDFAYGRTAYKMRDNGWAEDYTSNNISSPNVLGLIQTPFISPYAHFVKYDPALAANGGLTLVGTDKIYSGKDYQAENNPFMFAQSYGHEALINPYWILRNGSGENKNFHEQTQFNVNVAPKYQINKYLSVSNRFSYILNRTNEKYYLPKDGTPAKEVEGLGSVTSVVSTQFGKESTIYNDLRVDWNRQFGAHRVNVFGGFRLANYSYSDSYITGYNNDNDKMPNLSYSLQYKSYGGNNDTWMNLAYYLNADYNYKNKYFLKALATMETSSRFGDKTKEGIELCGVKWGFFPSVQLGWLISSEPWFKVKGINYLKLTGGYEESGNDNVDYYASRTYFQNIMFLDRATASQLANIGNPAIQWETNRKFNVGLQTSVLQNRLALGFEYYWSRTSNLLSLTNVDDVTGLSQMWSNDGELENRGYEVSVSAIPFVTRNWRMQLGFTVGHYDNELTSLPKSELNTIKTYQLDENGQRMGEPEVLKGYASSIYGQSNVLTAVGKPVGVFYGYKTNGVFADDKAAANAGKYGYLRYPTGLSSDPYREFSAGDVRFVDLNGDGWITEADKTVIGDPNPEIYGNIFASLAWKGLSLDLNFKYSLGNDVFNYQRQQLESANSVWNQTTAVCNRWRYQGQVTDMPRAVAASSDQWVNNERFSDRWIEDGSYLKLKKVRLTYKIPVSTSWLQGISVWGEANNVWTLTKYLGQDPEVSAGNSVLYQGIDAGYLPQNRNFNLGVTINL